MVRLYRQEGMEKVLTGTDSRMGSLPAADISSHHHHHSQTEETKEPMNTPLLRIDPSVAKSEENFVVNRKCVYTYEDKYTFARLLPSDCLIFDSHFESGNLHSAFRISSSDGAMGTNNYDLYIHNDVHTTGHTQWFYFSVSNMHAGQKVTFCLRNFSKPDSLFNDGMRPLMFSTKTNKWQRVGSNISYAETSYASRGSINADVSKKKKKFLTPMYTLTFDHTFENTDELCYFAYCHPYTYTDLKNYLHELDLATKHLKVLRRNTLCKTLAGNRCEVLTITDPSPSPEDIVNKTAVVITARVHPGETNASWMMHGILDFLCREDDEVSRSLRRNYVFKIVPMMNPDGVINGNYRTSLSGCDLNRRWYRPDKKLHPTIFYTKKLIQRLKKTNKIAYVIDLHGHSRKEGIFIYGCIPDKKLTRPSSPKRPIIKNFSTEISGDNDDNGVHRVETMGTVSTKTVYRPNLLDTLGWKVRLFPRLLDYISSHFTLESCNFKLHRSKASTMRMVNFIELGIDCVYTIEASLAGKRPYHFSAGDLRDFGESVGLALQECLPLLKQRKPFINSDSPVDKIKECLQLREEILEWTDIVDFDNVDRGCSLLSATGLRELQAAAVDGEGKDDDDSDIPDDNKEGNHGKEIKGEGKKSSKKLKSKKSSLKTESNKEASTVKGLTILGDKDGEGNSTVSTGEGMKNTKKHRTSEVKSLRFDVSTKLTVPSLEISDTLSNIVNTGASKATKEKRRKRIADIYSMEDHAENQCITDYSSSNVPIIVNTREKRLSLKRSSKAPYSSPPSGSLSARVVPAEKPMENHGNRKQHVHGQQRNKKGKRERKASMFQDDDVNRHYNTASGKQSKVIEMVLNDQCGLVSTEFDAEKRREDEIIQAYLRSQDIYREFDRGLYDTLPASSSSSSSSHGNRVPMNFNTNFHMNEDKIAWKDSKQELSILGRSGSMSVQSKFLGEGHGR